MSHFGGVVAMGQSVAGGGGGGSTWNSADKTTNITLSNGDLTASANNSIFESVRMTRNDFNTNTGGKYFWKLSIVTLTDAVNDLYFGLKQTSDTITSNVSFHGAGAHAMASSGNSGLLLVRGGWTATGASGGGTAGQELWFALDIPNRALYIALNGAWYGNSPTVGLPAVFTTMPLAADFAPFISTGEVAGTVTVTAITDAASLTADCPTGYTAGI